MADVFISYASEDRPRAGMIARALEGCGWSVWWDRKIVAGQAFDQTIERELDAAATVVVLWTAASVGSEWVKNEAAAAAERGVLVPVLLDDVKLPLEFRRRQAAGLVGWAGDPAHEGFEALRAAITGQLGAGATVPVAARSPEPIRQPRNLRAVYAAGGLLLALLLVLFIYARMRSAGPSEPAAAAGSTNLADLAVGTYFGSVVSDSRGSSQSDITVTITKLSPRRVRVASDYARLGSVDVDLTRIGSTVMNAGGSASTLMLDTAKTPVHLSWNPDGSVAYEGSKQ